MMGHRCRRLRLGLLAACLFGLATRGALAQKIQTIIGPANEDGLLATRVMLHAPLDVIVEPAGTVLVLEVGALRLSTGNFHLRPQIRRIGADGTLTRIAGNFLEGDTGDGGKATEASFIFPYQMAQDRNGTLYIVDRGAHRVRKIDPQGTITTVAGTGTAGFGGDGGKATEAQLSAPRGVAVDAQGNLYIGDSGNHRVRRVTPDGTIDTYAGNGAPEFAGDSGKATAASLASPRALAVDASGNLYIADYTNRRVRKVATDGTISTAAGSGEEGAGGDGGPARDATVQNPWQIDVDAAGNLYILQFGSERVRKVSADGTITTVAGTGTPGYSGDGGKATEAQLNAPLGMAVDGNNNLLIADTLNSRLRRIAPDGTITTFAGGGDPTGLKASQVTVLLPRGGVRDALGNVYVTDEPSASVLKISPEGLVTRVAGTGVPGGYAGEGKKGTEVSLGDAGTVGFYADGLAVDAQGNLYIPDIYQGRVYKLDGQGLLTTVAGNGQVGFSGDGGKATEAALSDSFWNLAVDAQSNLYIADGGNHRVRRVNAVDSVISTVAGNGSETYSGDGGKATEAGIPGPDGLALGPDGSLHICDTTDARVRKVSADGTITTVAGTGEDDFTGDGGKATEAAISVFTDNVAVDARGNLYLADGWNNRIRRVTAADGIIDTFAGTGNEGFNGDDKPFNETNITEPRDIYIDGAGNLIIAEWGTAGVPSDRIRTITLAP